MAASNSAQQFVAIDGIREDTIILGTGELRVVLMCSALNFALKSTDEQDAIIYQYQNFLNSLDFSLEFLIHSRRLNITPYLEALKERQKDEDGELLKIQIAEYAEFIRTFADLSNIMSKTFYIVIPFTPAIINQKQGLLDGLKKSLGLGKKDVTLSDELFIEYKNQLWQRVDTVSSGIQRLGIRTVPLNTQELIELFYGLYNPSEFEKAAVTETNNAR